VATVEGMGRWWRRQRPDEQRERTTGSPDAVDAGGHLPAVRVERALVALAVHAQQIEDRLARLEQQVVTLDDRTAEPTDVEAVTHDELLEVRVHSAKVAAELARLSVSLRARIDDVAVRVPATDDDRRHARARQLAESILDLSDRLEPTPLDLRDQPRARRTA
jgi:trehalose-6-phosphatase